MNIFDILKQLFTATTADWILTVDNNDINPVIIQRFLSLHRDSAKTARITNKFVYTLPPKMYLSTVWTLLSDNGKKYKKTPFIKYPKKEEKEHKYKFIHDKMKKQYQLSDTDFNVVEQFVNRDIEKNKVDWFSYYGAKREQWLKNDLDMTLLETYKERNTKPSSEKLDAWM